MKKTILLILALNSLGWGVLQNAWGAPSPRLNLTINNATNYFLTNTDSKVEYGTKWCQPLPKKLEIGSNLFSMCKSDTGVLSGAAEYKVKIDDKNTVGCYFSVICDTTGNACDSSVKGDVLLESSADYTVACNVTSASPQGVTFNIEVHKNSQKRG